MPTYIMTLICVILILFISLSLIIDELQEGLILVPGLGPGVTAHRWLQDKYHKGEKWGSCVNLTLPPISSVGPR